MRRFVPCHNGGHDDDAPTNNTITSPPSLLVVPPQLKRTALLLLLLLIQLPGDFTHARCLPRVQWESDLCGQHAYTCRKQILL